MQSHTLPSSLWRSLLGISLAFCALNSAQTAFADPPTVHLLKGSDLLDQINFDAYSCFISSQHLILEIPLEDAVGSDLRAFPNTLKPGDDPKAACAALREKPEKDALCCQEQGDEYFFGVWRDLLFSDEGSGEERGLIIYPLAPGKAKLSFDDVRDPQINTADNTLRFSHTLYELPAGVKVTCPEGSGSGGEDVTFRQVVVLNLESLAWAGEGPITCEIMDERGEDEDGGEGE